MAEPEKTPANINKFISGLFAPEDDALKSAIAEMRRAEMPPIYISPSEGKLLHVLALAAKAERILEIGTLGGYSTIWLARALPQNGRLITLEIDKKHADVARLNIANAGLADKVEVRLGPASESLAALASEGLPPFDLVFIDADKGGYVGYLEQALPLVRSGGLILADNTLVESALDPDADTGITRYNRHVAARTDLTSTITPTLRDVIDGLLISVKR